MMRKIILINLLFLISVSSFCQGGKENKELSIDYYLKKRSKNNTTAHLLFWGGLTVAIVGNTIDQQVNFDGPRGWFGFRTRGSNEYKHAGAAIAYSGLTAMAGSIPFFFFAVKNKRIARSLSLKNEHIQVLQKNGFANKSIPSINLKISL